MSRVFCFVVAASATNSSLQHSEDNVKHKLCKFYIQYNTIFYAFFQCVLMSSERAKLVISIYLLSTLTCTFTGFPIIFLNTLINRSLCLEASSSYIKCLHFQSIVKLDFLTSLLLFLIIPFLFIFKTII